MSLSGRHLLRLSDFAAHELTYLLDLAATLKAESRDGLALRRLVGKKIALIFEKDSIRTRCGFEVAAYDLGANVTIIGQAGSQIGREEPARDTARVLGRMYDAIECSGTNDQVIEQLATWSGVPVYN